MPDKSDGRSALMSHVRGGVSDPSFQKRDVDTSKAGISIGEELLALEEFSHLEVVGKLIEQHTKGIDKLEADAHASPLFALRGRGPHFVDDSGVSWTASYITVMSSNAAHGVGEQKRTCPNRAI